MFSFVKHWFCVKSLQDVTRNQAVFVGCSEIGVSVISKYVQHTEITRALCLPRGDLLSFSVPGGTEKIAGSYLSRQQSIPSLKLS